MLYLKVMIQSWKYKGPIFTGNRAQQGGAIDIDHHVYLRTTDCTFVDNHAVQNGGAINGGVDAVFEIQRTNFTRNSALQGGAIDIDHHVYLRTTDCTFVDNHAVQNGGAIDGGVDAVFGDTKDQFHT